MISHCTNIIAIWTTSTMRFVLNYELFLQSNSAFNLQNLGPVCFDLPWSTLWSTHTQFSSSQSWQSNFAHSTLWSAILCLLQLTVPPKSHAYSHWLSLNNMNFWTPHFHWIHAWQTCSPSTTNPYKWTSSVSDGVSSVQQACHSLYGVACILTTKEHLLLFTKI